MMALMRSIFHLSRKCPIGLPIWNSLPFLITDVVSGSVSVENGFFVAKGNPSLGLHRGEVTTYQVTRVKRGL